MINFDDLITEIDEIEDLFKPNEISTLNWVSKLLKISKISEASFLLEELRNSLEDISLTEIVGNWIYALNTIKNNGYLNNCGNFKSFNELVKEGLIDLSDNSSTIVSVKRELMGRLFLPDYIRKIENRAFFESNLSEVIGYNLEEFGESSFEDCPFLKKVISSNKVKEIPYRCFYGCPSLTDFTFSDNCEECGRESFYKTGLEQIVFNKNMKFIKDDAFGDCYDLEEVVNTDNLQIIGNRAFAGCESLESFNVFDNVLILGLRTFENCFSCDINIYSSKFKEDVDSFKGCKSINYITCENN